MSGLRHDAELDPTMVSEIIGRGYTVQRADGSRELMDAWRRVVIRGFLDNEPTDEQLQAFFERGKGHRMVGVYDPQAAVPEMPVATFAAWGARLTVPGGELESLAISSVTVAPTHRRRGLLRSLMGGELRAAARAGFPIASLTVSESSIYGRFGFAPAALSADVEISVRQAGWAGPEPDGRIDFLTREQGRAIADELHERVRAGRPGEVDHRAGAWDQAFGTMPAAEKAGAIRVIQYRSPAGQVDGLAIYTVTPNEENFPDSTLNLQRFIAATDDAYAALWRFLLSLDLIGTIRASELSIDEPLWWMVADRRAARVSVLDHHYLRVLDVAAALQSRRYERADDLVLDVTDSLGIAGGRFQLTTTESGTATVRPAESSATPDLQLGIAELSAMLLGGVSAVTLARAGRLRSDDPARVARLFAGSATPQLSFWY